ncbi:hypothetical protein AB0428_33715, partial [Streptomyces virginiae]|uniref:hypothetical protein n=1 Tax=Streptomyces virginiae TaxID=1961 RepID=UPI00345065B9
MRVTGRFPALWLRLADVRGVAPGVRAGSAGSRWSGRCRRRGRRPDLMVLADGSPAPAGHKGAEHISKRLKRLAK